ncbi:nuclear transport factor 2 family protein [Puia dinghuensis]|uniref:SnoaL-like domain-containing protein n=1 Tax=Puia dinghuensis TaxID=1792502 RepID=A0A8J2UCQ0_9BACT|nr:nuclear transport factor 2 family protein [Puia dinghuensis]GGA97716.1 hypothetical protein GCM10011511_21320 [Puia dinghuensis]
MNRLFYISVLGATMMSFAPGPTTGGGAATTQKMTAKELLLAYLSNIQNPQKVADLFAEDGAFEMPYFASVGFPTRYAGKEQIVGMITGLLKQAPTFKFINIKILIETPDQVFAEYEVDTFFNGKPYKQLYMGRLVARDGKIVLIREACDTAVIEKMKG